MLAFTAFAPPARGCAAPPDVGVRSGRRVAANLRGSSCHSNDISSANRRFHTGSLCASSPVVAPTFDDPQTYKIIGAAMAVHRALGCGFLENVSREALTIELQEQGIPFVREARMQVRYRNRVLPIYYIVDFICYDEILVELKALRAIGPIEEAQLINYMRIARRSRGLILNFGTTSLQHKRMVLDVDDNP